MAPRIPSDPMAPSFDDPLGMLSACHRRIERTLETLARLQRHLPVHGCDADARTAARGILKYFDTAAPNHHADEEASVFPRLLDLCPDRCSGLIATLGREHEQLEVGWRKLRPPLAAIAGDCGSFLAPKQVADLAAAYLAHVAREDNELLPLAAAAFDATTIAQIGQEMAARRGIDLAAPGRQSVPSA